MDVVPAEEPEITPEAVMTEEGFVEPYVEPAPAEEPVGPGAPPVGYETFPGEPAALQPATPPLAVPPVEVPAPSPVIAKIQAQERFQAEKLRAAGRVEEADFVQQRAEKIAIVEEQEKHKPLADAIRRLRFKPAFATNLTTIPGIIDNDTIPIRRQSPL